MSLVKSKRHRILTVICSVWLAIVLFLALNAADGSRSFDVVSFITAFGVFGAIPVFLVFGIAWIRRSELSDTSCPDCGSSMRFHSPSSGDTAGKMFLICNKFPQCRKILLVSTKGAVPLDGGRA